MNTRSSDHYWGVLSGAKLSDIETDGPSKHAVMGDDHTGAGCHPFDASLSESTSMFSSPKKSHYAIAYSTPLQAPACDSVMIGLSDSPLRLDALETSNADSVPLPMMTRATSLQSSKSTVFYPDASQRSSAPPSANKPLPVSILGVSKAINAQNTPKQTRLPAATLATRNADTNAFVKSVFSRASPGLVAQQHQATPMRLQCPPTPLRTPGSGRRSHSRETGHGLDAVPMRRMNSLQDTKLLIEFVPADGATTPLPVGQLDLELSPLSGSNNESLRLDEASTDRGTALVFHPDLYEEPDTIPSSTDDSSISFHRDFSVARELGQGSFNSVVEAVHKADGRHYAVKRTIKTLRSKRDRELRWREMQMFLRLKQHPHIITYYRAWQEDMHMYFQMELCRGGTVRGLQDALPRGTALPESTVWAFIAHVSSALAHMHNVGIVHLDIKPENVFIDGSFMKVGDLGLAFDFSERTSTSNVDTSFDSALASSTGGHSSSRATSNDDTEGDCRYMAPELLNSGGRAPPADMFSLGVSALELAWDVCIPQDGEAWHDLREGRIVDPRAQLKRSPELISTVLAMLCPEPQDRLTAADVLDMPQVKAILQTSDPFLTRFATAGYDMSKTDGYIVLEAVPEPDVTIPPPPIAVSRGQHLGRSESYTNDMIVSDIDAMIDVTRPYARQRSAGRPSNLQGIREADDLDAHPHDVDGHEQQQEEREEEEELYSDITSPAVTWNSSDALSPLFAMPRAGPAETRAAHAVRSRTDTSGSATALQPRRLMEDADALETPRVTHSFVRPTPSDAQRIAPRVAPPPVAAAYSGNDMCATGKRCHGGRYAIRGVATERIVRTLGFNQMESAKDAGSLEVVGNKPNPFTHRVNVHAETKAAEALQKALFMHERKLATSPIATAATVLDPPVLNLHSTSSGSRTCFSSTPGVSSMNEAFERVVSALDDMSALRASVPSATPLRPGVHPRHHDGMDVEYEDNFAVHRHVAPGRRRAAAAPPPVFRKENYDNFADEIAVQTPVASPARRQPAEFVIPAPHAPAKGRREAQMMVQERDDDESCRSPHAKRQQICPSPSPTMDLTRFAPTDAVYVPTEAVSAPAAIAVPRIHVNRVSPVNSPVDGFITPASQAVKLTKQHWNKF